MANDDTTDRPDFESLVRDHSDFVYNVAFRMMGNHEDAEDVAQEAFLSGYRAFDRFRGDSRVTTWLYRITVNAALMRLRKTKLARSLTPHRDRRPRGRRLEPDAGPRRPELRVAGQAEAGARPPRSRPARRRRAARRTGALERRGRRGARPVGPGAQVPAPPRPRAPTAIPLRLRRNGRRLVDRRAAPVAVGRVGTIRNAGSPPRIGSPNQASCNRGAGDLSSFVGSGCSAAEARLVWDQEVAGSNPATPTR